MPEFYFQIKGKRDNNGYSTWEFPPIWSDKIEAKDRKEAKAIISEMYSIKFPTRVLGEDIESHQFILNLKELKGENPHYAHLFEIKECRKTGCNNKFRLIEKYQAANTGGGSYYCSSECSKISEAIDYYGKLEDGGMHNPVIYKITNRNNGKCYIGKTSQAFTFRWYQHFFQSKTSNTKFHKAIQGSKISDWSFEVVEMIVLPETILDQNDKNSFIIERESYWIKQHDSINNGYNTTISISDKNNKSITPELELE